MKRNVLLLAIFLSAGSLMAQNWEQRSSIPGNSARHHPVTWGIGDTGYVVTGTTNSSFASKDFYRYDATSDSWDQMPDFPGPQRSFAIGTVYNGKGYMGFGANPNSYLNDIWEYDPQTGSWSQLTTCPCSGRRHPSLVMTSGKLFVGLGDDASGNLRDWWEYDMASDTWTQRANVPGPSRHHPFQFDIDGQAYAGMGHGASIYKDWFRFDPTDSSWTIMSDFPGEARVAGTQFSHNNRGYVLSGDGSDHGYMSEGEFWQYDPVSQVWSQLPPHPGVSRWAPGSFVIGDTVYFTGGENRQQNSLNNDLWAFDMSYLMSTPQFAGAGSIDIFPNPASDYIRFSEEAGIKEVELLDMRGQRVMSGSYTGERVNISQLSPGAYLVRARDKNGDYHSARILKK